MLTVRTVFYATKETGIQKEKDMWLLVFTHKIHSQFYFGGNRGLHQHNLYREENFSLNLLRVGLIGTLILSCHDLIGKLKILL